jgi:hypothetical protein
MQNPCSSSPKKPQIPKISKSDSRKRKAADLSQPVAAKKSSIPSPSIPKPSYLVNSMPVSPVQEIRSPINILNIYQHPKDPLFHPMNNYNKLTLYDQQLVKAMASKSINKPPVSKSELTRSIPVPKQTDLTRFVQVKSSSSVQEREVIDLVSDDEVSEVFPTIEEEKKINQTVRQLNTPVITSQATHSRAETSQLPAKRLREETQESRVCFICKWKFPLSFGLINKQVHINKCIEGHGRDDIIEYRKSEQAIRRIQKRDTTECPESNSTTPQKRRLCPICNKFLTNISEEFLKDHMNQCEGGSHISISSDSSQVSTPPSPQIAKPKIIGFEQWKKLVKVKDC